MNKKETLKFKSMSIQLQINLVKKCLFFFLWITN